MSKKIPVSDLAEGLIYSEPIYFADGENILVKANTPITKKNLDMLKTWNFTYVLSSGVPLNKKDKTDDVNEANLISPNVTVKYKPNPTRSESILSISVELKSTEVYRVYLELIYSANTVFEKLKKRQLISDNVVSEIVENVKEMILDQPDVCVSFILHSDVEGYNMSKSAIDTAILCYIISKHLELEEDKIDEIVTAAILHDVGMLRINNEILEKTEKLTENEMQTIEAHPIYGFKCVVSELLYTESIGKLVMQHHERWDGDGYPNRLFENEIDIGARILSVADAFIAMTSEKSYRQAMLGYEAMKNLLVDNGHKFDPNVVKATIQSIGIHPIGSTVLLSNTSICRVVKSTIDAPLRPKLKVLIDENSVRYPNDTGEIIDLNFEKNLFIVQAIDPRTYRSDE